MTEKRFGYGAGVNWQEDVIIDYETEQSYNFYEVGKLLNELDNENQKLKIENDALKKFVKFNFGDMMVERMEKELKND